MFFFFPLVPFSLLSQIMCLNIYRRKGEKMGFSRNSDGKESACNAGDSGSIPGSRRSLKKGMATYSSIHAWRISGTEEPGRL